MSKRKRRVPRYVRQDPAWREAEAQRQSGIPPGAIPADLSQQAPNNSYDPLLYYRDYEFHCIDCGEPQVWTAKQQQWWYEVAKGSVYSRADRCRKCRVARRAAQRGTPRKTQADRNREAE